MGDFVCTSKCRYSDKYSYINDGKLLGVYCIKCNQEWLAREYVPVRNYKEHERILIQSKPEDVYLYKIKATKLPVETSFQIQSARTVLENDDDLIEQLEPGDHITLQRPYLIHHHAIVIKKDIERDMVQVIHWKKQNKTIKIIEEEINLREEKGKLGRVDYPKMVTARNPTELVIARAKSRVGKDGYDFFFDNCESFATYCRTGVNQSHQVSWLIRKIMESLLHLVKFAIDNWKDALRLLSKRATPEVVEKVAEAIESLPLTTKYISAVLIFGFEFASTGMDCFKIYKKYKSGQITGYDCVKSIFERFVESAFVIGLAVLGSLIPGIGGIIGATVGAVVGKFVGRVLGPVIWNLGCAIKKIFFW